MSDFTPPRRLAAGTTWKWDVLYTGSGASGSVYSESGALSYVLRFPSKERVDISSVREAGSWKIDVPASVTATHCAGTWNWFAFVEDGEERHQVGSGTLEITPNAAADGDADLRTGNEIALANIRAVLEDRATKNQKSYMIGDRQLVFTGLDELLKLERHYARLVRRDQAEANGKPLSAFATIKHGYDMEIGA